MTYYTREGSCSIVGNLGKLGMLHEDILYKSMKQLQEKKEVKQVQEILERVCVEDISCLCQIFQMFANELNNDHVCMWMAQYLQRVHVCKTNLELSSYVRLVLEDVAKLHTDKWQSNQNIPTSNHYLLLKRQQNEQFNTSDGKPESLIAAAACSAADHSGAASLRSLDADKEALRITNDTYSKKLLWTPCRVRLLFIKLSGCSPVSSLNEFFI